VTFFVTLSLRAGRVCRPLFIVTEDQKLAIKKQHVDEMKDVTDSPFTSLMEKGLIELIDCEEVRSLFLSSLFFPIC
jgi:DNA-directed RNA polymerase beta subunit